jgi:hypothetical protein
MGWNGGYTIFEATVVGAYDLGKLDKALLSVLMEPYRDTDIDSGGREGLESKNGKNVEEICIEVWGLQLPPKPNAKDEDAMDDYQDNVDELFDKVTAEFGW